MSLRQAAHELLDALEHIGYIDEGVTRALEKFGEALRVDTDGKNAARWLWIRDKVNVTGMGKGKDVALRGAALDEWVDRAIAAERRGQRHGLGTSAR